MAVPYLSHVTDSGHEPDYPNLPFYAVDSGHSEQEHKIFDALGQFENVLSLGSAIPWGGVLFANIKIITGVALTALGVLAIGLATLGVVNKRYVDRCHRIGREFLLHGIVNVIAGFIEKILLVGTLFWIIRLIQAKKDHWSHWLFPTQLSPWLPYPERPDVIDLNAAIANCPPEVKEEQQRLLNQCAISLGQIVTISREHSKGVQPQEPSDTLAIQRWLLEEYERTKEIRRQLEAEREKLLAEQKLQTAIKSQSPRSVQNFSNKQPPCSPSSSTSSSSEKSASRFGIDLRKTPEPSPSQSSSPSLWDSFSKDLKHLSVAKFVRPKEESKEEG